MKIHTTILCTLTALLVCGILFTYPAEAAETTISNSVSVQAGSGTSKASIQTMVNGKQIEGISYTSENESINVTSTYNDTKQTTEISHTTDSTSEAILRAKLMELLALLQHYVYLYQ